MQTWASGVGRAGFHLLNSPFSVLHFKNDKVAPWRTLGNAGLAPTAQSWRPLSDSGPRAKCSHTSLTDLGLFVCLSPYLARPRLPFALRGKPSRHTLGWRPTVAALPAGPRSASVQTRKRRGGWEKSASRSFLFLRWMCERSNDSLGSVCASPMGGRKPPRGARSNSVVAFPFMW